MPKAKAAPAKPAKKSPMKAKRQKKDPNAPKKAAPAYMLWLKEMRPSITKPGMGVTDVAKEAGVLWNKLGDKSKWEKLAAKDKERYAREKAAYDAGGASGSKSPKKGKK